MKEWTTWGLRRGESVARTVRGVGMVEAAQMGEATNGRDRWVVEAVRRRERRWGVAGCPPVGETSGAVEAGKRRGRRALEAAAAGGGEQAAGGGAGHWRPRPRIRVFMGDGPHTNWQMGLTWRMCLCLHGLQGKISTTLLTGWC
jgi:hypothetical protein